MGLGENVYLTFGIWNQESQPQNKGWAILDWGGHFFMQKVVKLYSSLPWIAVEFQSLNSFKSVIAKFQEIKRMKGFGDTEGK